MRFLWTPFWLFVFIIVASCNRQLQPPKNHAATLRRVALTKTLRLAEIKKDVFLVTHDYPWPANSLLVKVSDKLAVWVDTPYTDEATKTVLQWMHQTLGEIEIVEINTGYHVDNLGGNGVLVGVGIPVYGSTLSAKLLLEKGETTRVKILEWLTGPENMPYFEVHKTMTYVPPDNLFEIEADQTVFPVHPSVEVYYPGPSHAQDNLVVYFKAQRVLFGGCLLKSADAQNLGFRGDADMRAWPTSVERVREKYPDVELVVPGHGDPSDGTLPTHTLSLLQQTGIQQP